MERPEETFARLGEFLGVSFDHQTEMIRNTREIHLGHQLMGNRMRSQNKIFVKMDVEWKDMLRSRYKLLFWLLDWSFALFYGYGKSLQQIRNPTSKMIY